jgi:uncharacterized protein
LIVVFDCSTVVGAALKPSSTPMRALLAAVEHATLALSTAVHDEIRQVLRRPKFAATFMPERQAAILEILTTGAVWVEPDVSVTDCVDPNDNKYLELALAAGAAVIVSSDNHLLSLDPWRGARILRPAAFLSR